MRTVSFWNWTVADELTGKRRRTRFQMTEQQAKDWPGAVKVDGTLTVRDCPETDAERGLLAPKAFDMRPREHVCALSGLVADTPNSRLQVPRDLLGILDRRAITQTNR